jgi:LPS-assembly protein
MISPLHLRALAAAALCCAPVLTLGADADSAICPASTPGFVLPMFAAAAAAAAPNVLKRSASPRVNEDITLESDDATQTPDGYSVLTGNVDVHMGDREIQADQITHNADNSSFNAVGQVQFRNPTVLISGDAGHYDDDGALFNHAQFHFLQQTGFGSADQIALSPNNILTLKNVTYTSCPPPHADWRIRAGELRLDTAAGEGVGRHARLEVQDIPILYLPWISFPLSDARKSGFLFPEFASSSQNGFTMVTPWYWNIAPNQDATFTPSIYSLRGIDLGAQYRFLSQSNSGSINGNFLPDDQRQRGDDRSYVRLLDRLKLPANSRIDLNYENVSDTQYFEDFSQGTESTSTPFLTRELSIRHRDDIWNVRAQLLGFQNLDTVNLPEVQRPYIELPRIGATSNWIPRGWPLLNLGLDSEVVNFTRSCLVHGPDGIPDPTLCTGLVDPQFPLDAAVNGWRLNGRPHVGLDLSGPGYFFRPTAALDVTRYELRDIDGSDRSPQRTVPIIDVDTGLQFERMSGPHNVRSVTFEPRVMYVYIPYRDQTQLPVFDSSTPDLNSIELFRPNRFVGLDRIGDSNSLNVGATTQWFENASGARYLSATLAQAFYLQRPRVTTPDESLAPRTTSSLIAEINLTAYRHWNIQVDVASSPTVSRIEQAEVMTQYLANNKQVVNVGYLYRYGVLQQVDGSAAWPVSRHWDLYARAVYSLYRAPPPAAGAASVRPGSIEDFAGFQYRGNCWSIRTVAQRSISTRTGASDLGVSLQFELTGLSSVGNEVGTGSGVSTFLEQSIRGYSASAGKPYN